MEVASQDGPQWHAFHATIAGRTHSSVRSHSSWAMLFKIGVELFLVVLYGYIWLHMATKVFDDWLVLG